jgi:V/A-type H+-transporting ATPase subunit D
MVKLKLTKNELKKQKESLKRFRRYLPMLQLKKKQLQLEIIKIRQAIREVSQQAQNLRREIIAWVDIFAEKISFEDFFSLVKIKTSEGNVAGIDLPIFLDVEFKEQPYDLMAIPLWVDKAIEVLKQTLISKAKLAIYHKQVEILKEELRIVNQRVNLFEKVKIPESQENIRIIQISLGELRTAEVVRGKIAKAKIERAKIIQYQT